MTQGFEVDWDLLDQAGSRFLAVHEDVRTPVLRHRADYGSEELEAAALAVQQAWQRHVVWLLMTTEAIGAGLKSSARWYSEADAVVAAERFLELSR